MQDLTCQELVEIVTEYLEGAMAPGDRIRFETHLVFCDGCAIYVDQLRETVRLTGTLREEDLSEDAREALLETFRGWRD